jgi:pentatricopeptide repeat protein
METAGVKRGPQSFHEALAACAKQGDLPMALKMLEVMKVKGVAVSGDAYYFAVSACQDSDQVRGRGMMMRMMGMVVMPMMGWVVLSLSESYQRSYLTVE